MQSLSLWFTQRLLKQSPILKVLTSESALDGIGKSEMEISQFSKTLGADHLMWYRDWHVQFFWKFLVLKTLKRHQA